MILDPFCGCGTTVAVAESLNRKWIGIDVTMLAINLIKRRMEPSNIKIFIDGIPKDLAGAKALFKKNPFEFEYWVLDLLNATPSGGKTKDKMAGADKGIDGVITFHADKVNDKYKYGKALIQVKGGKVQRGDIATLKGDVEREKAEGGVFVTLEKPTKPMIEEVVICGHFTTPITNKVEFPKIQILSVEELLWGKRPNLPQGLVKNYYKEARAYQPKEKASQNQLLR